MPEPEEIGKLYPAYHTHYLVKAGRSAAARFYDCIRKGVLRKKLGYRVGVGPDWHKCLAPLAFFHPAGSMHAEEWGMFLPQGMNGNRLLDIGCGNGAQLARMAEMGWEAYGIDPDAYAVKAAQSIGCHAQVGDVRDQDYPSDFFDAIHLGNVIEHVHQPVEILMECFRILKTGGQLVLSTPNTDSWGFSRFRGSWRGLEPPRHLYLYNVKTIRALLEQAGFPSGSLHIKTRVTDMLANSAWLSLQGGSASRSPNDFAGFRIRNRMYQIYGRVLLHWNRLCGDEIVCWAAK